MEENMLQYDYMRMHGLRIKGWKIFNILYRLIWKWMNNDNREMRIKSLSVEK